MSKEDFLAILGVIGIIGIIILCVFATIASIEESKRKIIFQEKIESLSKRVELLERKDYAPEQRTND